MYLKVVVAVSGCETSTCFGVAVGIRDVGFDVVDRGSVQKISALDMDDRTILSFSVFFHADLQTRIRRIAKIYDLTDAKAKDRIIKTDKKRSSYYNYYTSKRWGDADL